MKLKPPLPVHRTRDERDPRLPNRLRRRVRDFNRKWGDIFQLVLGAFLVAVAIVVLVIALNVRTLNQMNDRQSKRAEYQSALAQNSAHKTCERSRVFGPPLADLYGRTFHGRNGVTFRVLNDEQLAAYRATIPTSCPPLIAVPKKPKP